MGLFPSNPILHLRQEEVRKPRYWSGGGCYPQIPQGMVAYGVCSRPHTDACSTHQLKAPPDIPSLSLKESWSREHRDQCQMEPLLETPRQTHTHQRAGRDLRWWPSHSWWVLHRWPSQQLHKGTPALHTWRPHWKCLKQKWECGPCGLGSQACPGTGRSTFLMLGTELVILGFVATGKGAPLPLQDVWCSSLGWCDFTKLSDILAHQALPLTHSRCTYLWYSKIWSWQLLNIWQNTITQLPLIAIRKQSHSADK